MEHAIGRIKRYGITKRPFWSTPEELNDELNIIAGLVNLDLDWDKTKDENATPMQELARKRAAR